MILKRKTTPEIKIYKDEMIFNISLIIKNKTYYNSMKCTLDQETKTILIGDIYIKNDRSLEPWNYTKFINKGYGTLMMNELLKFAKENNYEKITGNISDVDNNTEWDPHHRERLIHFYKKFGFKILPDDLAPKQIELIL